MRYIKSFNQINEEESILKNLLISTALSLGINMADAQTIQSDSLKTEVIQDISNYNKLALTNSRQEMNIESLKLSLSKKIEEPELFIDKYLQMLPNGTFVVKPNFIEGLEIYLRNNSFRVGYNIKF